MTSKNKVIVRIISIFLTAAFGPQEVLLAAPEVFRPVHVESTAIPPALVLKNPALFEAPSDAFVLSETHTGTNGRLIIHIQDAHANLSGQESLARGLDLLVRRYGWGTVLVEGGDGDVSLDAIKPLADPEDWRRVGRKFLMQGKIAGEEFLNLTSDLPLRLVGVEDPVLYRRALVSYARLAARRKRLLTYLHRVRVSLERVKGRVYPKELLAFESLPGPAEESWEKKTGRLLDWADRIGVDRSDLKSAAVYRRLRALESEVDFDAASKDLSALERDLKAGGPDAPAGEPELHETAAGMRSGVAAAVERARLAGIALGGYPHFAAYADYVRQAAGLDSQALFAEAEILEARVYDKLLPGEDARKVRAIDRHLALLDRAFRIRLSAPDHHRLTEEESEFRLLALLAYLNRRLIELGYGEDLVPTDGMAMRIRKAREAFYESVEARDLEFVRNTGRILDQTAPAAAGGSAAFLIAGGYHTRNLTRLLRESGYSYVVLTPIVKDATDQTVYERVLLSDLKDRPAAPAAVSTVRAPAVWQSGSRLNELIGAVERLSGRQSGAAGADSGVRRILAGHVSGAKPDLETTQNPENNPIVARAKKQRSWGWYGEGDPVQAIVQELADHPNIALQNGKVRVYVHGSQNRVSGVGPDSDIDLFVAGRDRALPRQSRKDPAAARVTANIEKYFGLPRKVDLSFASPGMVRESKARNFFSGTIFLNEYDAALREEAGEAAQWMRESRSYGVLGYENPADTFLLQREIVLNNLIQRYAVLSAHEYAPQSDSRFVRLEKERDEFSREALRLKSELDAVKADLNRGVIDVRVYAPQARLLLDQSRILIQRAMLLQLMILAKSGYPEPWRDLGEPNVHGARLAKNAVREVEIRGDLVGAGTARGQVVVFDPASAEAILYAISPVELDAAIDKFHELTINIRTALSGSPLMSDEDLERLPAEDRSKIQYLDAKVQSVLESIYQKPAATNPAALLIADINRDIKSESEGAEAKDARNNRLSVEDLEEILDLTRAQSLALAEFYHASGEASLSGEQYAAYVKMAVAELGQARRIIERFIRRYGNRAQKANEEAASLKQLESRLKAGIKSIEDELVLARQTLEKGQASGGEVAAIEGRLKKTQNQLDKLLESQKMNRGYLGLLQAVPDEIKKNYLKDDGVIRSTAERMVRQNRNFASIIYEDMLLTPRPEILQKLGIQADASANRTRGSGYFQIRRQARKRLEQEQKARPDVPRGSLNGYNLFNTMNDVIDVHNGIIAALTASSQTYKLDILDDQADFILVVKDQMTVGTFLQIMEKYGPRIKGIIANEATRNSHWVIESQNVADPPIVLITSRKLPLMKPGQDIMISGESKIGEGASYVHPSARRLTKSNLERRRQELILAMAKKSNRRLNDRDELKNFPFRVRANISPTRAEGLEANGADGSGLIRTEIVSEATEVILEESLEASAANDPGAVSGKLRTDLEGTYQSLLMDPALRGQYATFRTFDFQEDKNEDFLARLKELKHERPDLFAGAEDVAGFDFYKTVPGREILTQQLAAIFLARLLLPGHTKKPRVRIMFPRVRNKADLDFVNRDILPAVRSIVAEEMMKRQPERSMTAESIERSMRRAVEFGVMIEFFEAVDNIQDILRHPLSGFLSVGTNDLTADVISRVEHTAVSRDNPVFEDKFTELNPHVLEKLKNLAWAVSNFNIRNKTNKSLGFCGEIAGTHKFLLFMVYLNNQYKIPMSSSMSVGKIPLSKFLLSEAQRQNIPGELADIFGNPNEVDTDARAEELARQLVLDSDAYQRGVTVKLRASFGARLAEGGMTPEWTRTLRGFEAEPGLLDIFDSIVRGMLNKPAEEHFASLEEDLDSLHRLFERALESSNRQPFHPTKAVKRRIQERVGKILTNLRILQQLRVPKSQGIWAARRSDRKMVASNRLLNFLENPDKFTPNITLRTERLRTELRHSLKNKGPANFAANDIENQLTRHFKAAADALRAVSVEITKAKAEGKGDPAVEADFRVMLARLDKMWVERLREKPELVPYLGSRLAAAPQNLDLESLYAAAGLLERYGVSVKDEADLKDPKSRVVWMMAAIGQTSVAPGKAIELGGSAGTPEDFHAAAVRRYLRDTGIADSVFNVDSSPDASDFAPPVPTIRRSYEDFLKDMRGVPDNNKPTLLYSIYGVYAPIESNPQWPAIFDAMPAGGRAVIMPYRQQTAAQQTSAEQNPDYLRKLSDLASSRGIVLRAVYRVPFEEIRDPLIFDFEKTASISGAAYEDGGIGGEQTGDLAQEFRQIGQGARLTAKAVRALQKAVPGTRFTVGAEQGGFYNYTWRAPDRIKVFAGGRSYLMDPVTAAGAADSNTGVTADTVRLTVRRPWNSQTAKQAIGELVQRLRESAFGPGAQPVVLHADGFLLEGLDEDEVRRVAETVKLLAGGLNVHMVFDGAYGELSASTSALANPIHANLASIRRQNLLKPDQAGILAQEEKGAYIPLGLIAMLEADLARGGASADHVSRWRGLLGVPAVFGEVPSPEAARAMAAVDPSQMHLILQTPALARLTRLEFMELFRLVAEAVSVSA